MTAAYQTARKTSSSSSASMVVFAIIIRIWNTMSKALSTSAATMTSKTDTKITKKFLMTGRTTKIAAILQLPPFASAALRSRGALRLQRPPRSIPATQLQSQLQQLQLEAHSSPIPSHSLSQSQQPLPQLEPRPPKPLSLMPPGANSTAEDTSYAGAGTTGANTQANANASATRSPTSPVPHHPELVALPPPPALSRPPSDNAAPGYLSVNPTFHPPVYALTPLGLPTGHRGSHHRMGSRAHRFTICTGNDHGERQGGHPQCSPARSYERCFKQQCSIYKNGKRLPSETASGFGMSVTANSGTPIDCTENPSSSRPASDLARYYCATFDDVGKVAACWTESYPENVGAAVARLLMSQKA
ncbi:hypothetical protein B0H11DRAFT_1920282 [Mycena galericulata]|nr:hypothetical protein B0H11DRAFT_1920282 [Mycena galericulata]